MKMNAQPSVVARRTVLAAGAVGTVGLVAACGDSSDATDSSTDSSGSTGTATTSPAPSASSSSGSGSTALASTSDIPVGSGKIFQAEKVVVTQPAAGEFKCFSAICTHQGCPVSQIDTEAITCTCHQSRFSLTDGSVLGGPATSPLPAKTITVTGTEITLD